jgi:hypothetical protein
MTFKYRTFGGHRLARQESGWWSTEDGRFRFHKSEIASRCQGPHATTNGYCWGDGEHIRVRYEAFDGRKNITVAPDGWRRLVDAINFVVSEYKPD